MPDRFLITKTDLATGVLCEEKYERNGVLHRDYREGPALVRREGKDGTIHILQYCQYGENHRIGGPAMWSRTVDHENLAVPNTPRISVHEEYWQNGMVHRDPEEGPALIFRDGETNVTIHESYVFNGIMHRDPSEGPALIRRQRFTGHIIAIKYYFEGEYHRDPQEGPASVDYDFTTGELKAQCFYVHGKVTQPPRRPSAMPSRAATSGPKPSP